ncbi:glycosyl hydrolase family 95 catalytic domain-containing protein [Lacisediminihabitans sp.]|uniref:glycoside hydrolase family 95 protein n=1 Tax=Lacisediminihabitans sp. TaxID=2787631 RepID=UPI00374CF672
MTTADDTLLYDSPASDWLSALPLGNGMLGSMVYGGSALQRFQINDGLAWSGSPSSEAIDPVDREAFAATLAEVRAQLLRGEYVEAEKTATGLQHRHSQSFLPFGELAIAVAPHGDVSSYSRSLELATGLHRETYSVAEFGVTWTSFVSVTPGVLVIRMATDLPAGLDLALSLSTPLRVLATDYGPSGATLRLKAPSDVFPPHDAGGVAYSDDPVASAQGALAVRWEHDGSDVTEHGVLGARGVHALTIYVSTQTTLAAFGATPTGDAESALGVALDRLAVAAAEPYARLLDRHLQSHGELFGRVRLRLGDRSVPTPGAVPVPTDRRLAEANEHPHGAIAADPGLAELLFNYGRYLLIGSSRPGGAPANLQGIWNAELPAPWSSNYTININLQMNYWAAEAVGLAECLEPLFDLIDLLRTTGTRTARELYGAGGWAAHHNADVWGYSHPVGHGRAKPRWSLWPMASLWLVQHLWDHLEFAAPGDPAGDAFLRDRAWPAIRGAAEFGLDWLVELPDGTLGTVPSTSPENAFLGSGETAEVGISSTMDLTMLREVFGHVAVLSERLGLQGDPVVARAAAALPRIPGPSVGRGGQIREWLADDPQVEPNHRHMSHLWFLHPGATQDTPELRRGASASLDARGRESTGWSLSWKIALRARLGQGDEIDELLRLVFRDMTVDRGGQSGGLYPNLLAAHPPYQIDGNFGYVAGLVEALQQSHAGELVLLPALPSSLPNGEVVGLRGRGGVSTSLRWRDGLLVSAEVTSGCEQTVRVRYGERVWSLELTPGQPQPVPLEA